MTNTQRNPILDETMHIIKQEDYEGYSGYTGYMGDKGATAAWKWKECYEPMIKVK